MERRSPERHWETKLLQVTTSWPALHTAGAPDSSPAIHRGHAGRGALWSAALQSGTGKPSCLQVTTSWPALHTAGPPPVGAGLQSGNSPRACGPRCPMERRSPERHWETKLLQVATSWPNAPYRRRAGLQSGNSPRACGPTVPYGAPLSRAALGNQAAPGRNLMAGAPYRRRAGLQSGNSPRACGPRCRSGERRSIGAGLETRAGQNDGKSVESRLTGLLPPRPCTEPLQLSELRPVRP